MRHVARCKKIAGLLGCNQILALCLTMAGVAWPGPPRAPLAERQVARDAVAEPNAEQRARYLEVARHWAPALYQDTDSSLYVGDYITKFNYDGDYNGKNNWEHLEGRTSLPAYVYYAVSETNTHYFVVYGVYHPRDWHEFDPLDMHENDFEGLSLALRKDGAEGELVAMETLAHHDFWQYSRAAGIDAGLEAIDGRVGLNNGSHPRVYIEPKGHGIFACDSRCDRAVEGDGILYEVGDRAESPTGGDGDFTRHYHYALIAMDSDGSSDGNQGFWYRRNDICDTCTFGAWGKLRGDNYGTNSAAMPWVWRDADRAPVRSGDMICDPAFFFDAHLNGSPFDFGFSHHYVSQPFRTHVVTERDPENAAEHSGWYVLSPELAYRPQALRFGGETSEHSLCRREPSWSSDHGSPPVDRHILA
ncbi:MAG TPA: hypothetical protein VGP93_20320, partial [Polyangiaceae bacterium]|nr:hypothetical protein [Polyangiaceae bacterium]